MSRAHDKDRQFLALLRTASLAELESWLADLDDPDSNAQHLETWQRLAIHRAYKRLTGKEPFQT